MEYPSLVFKWHKTDTDIHVTSERETAVLQHSHKFITILVLLTPTVTSQSYSSEIKIQLRPAEQWGFCHTEHDGGYTNVGNYQRLLDPSKGLYLEMYRNDASEKYCIKYIVVDVDLD